jgi:hypothetical protein
MPEETVVHNGQTFKVIDKRPLGFYCVYCKQFNADVQMDERGLWDPSNDGSSLIYKRDLDSLEPKVLEVWRVFQHYDGCRGWE